MDKIFVAIVILGTLALIGLAPHAKLGKQPPTATTTPFYFEAVSSGEDKSDLPVKKTKQGKDTLIQSL